MGFGLQRLRRLRGFSGMRCRVQGFRIYSYEESSGTCGLIIRGANSCGFRGPGLQGLRSLVA